MQVKCRHHEAAWSKKLANQSIIHAAKTGAKALILAIVKDT